LKAKVIQESVKMKRSLLLLFALVAVLIGILIVACEKHKDPFSANNVEPVIADFRFKSDNVLPNNRSDSLKFKVGKTYALHLEYEDREFSSSGTRKLQARFSFESGSGTISHDQFGNSSANGLTFEEVPGKFNGDLLFTPDSFGVVSLKLQLSDGVKISGQRQVSTTFFPNLPPIASFTFELRSQTNPYEVRFDPTRSIDRDGTIAKFIWTYDDNSKSDTANANASITHKFEQAGRYRVRLKVVDDEGEVGSTEQFVPTANQSPVAALQVFPQSGAVPLAINYTAEGSFDPDGNISSYQILFGDGGTSQTPTGTHIYETDKNYQVLVIVKDNLGLADTANVPVRVSTPPIAALKIDPDTGGKIPLPLTISGKASRDPHPGGTITAYQITITNLATSAQQVFPQDSVSTTLLSPANYLISLEVRNNRGLTARAEKVIPAGLP
jgi:PKD repeat protein